jgi:hypothetical protein
MLGLDASHNNISEIPTNVSRLVYLNELDISCTDIFFSRGLALFSANYFPASHILF